MVTFELVETYEDGWLYVYFPEDRRDHPGYIGIRGGERFIKQLSDADIGTLYAGHCFKHLNGSESGIAAWY